MTVQEVMIELKQMGNEQTKKTLTKHGAKEPFFGVKVADLKKIVKRVKKNHQLSLDLFETGNSDAMYLAGLIADETKMSKKELEKWADQAYWSMISEYSVAGVTSESPYAMELALKWIDSGKENVASAGWAALSGHIAITPNEQLDMKTISKLIDRVKDEIHNHPPNRVRYTMNGFIIGVGAYIPELTDKALSAGEKIGKVNVDMNGTACKVPSAVPYINKIIQTGRHGKKRKVARC